MGWFVGGAAETLNATGDVVEKTGNMFDKLFTSDEERLASKQLMAKINQNPAKWAHELNLINAKDSSWFNSGWRPAIGWVLTISIACYFIPKFLLGSIIWAKHSWKADAILPYPVDDSGLWQLAAMMLGVGVTRSFDKLKGQAKG